ILGKIIIAEGTEGVAVNSVIAVLLEEGESAGDIGDVEVFSSPCSMPAVSDMVPAASAPSSVPAQPVQSVTAEKDWSGPTVNITVREALRDAMAEEMRA